MFPHATLSWASCLHHHSGGGWRRQRATAALLWAQKLKHPQRVLDAVAIAALLPIFATVATIPTRTARVVVTECHTSSALTLNFASLAALIEQADQDVRVGGNSRTEGNALAGEAVIAQQSLLSLCARQ